MHLSLRSRVIIFIIYFVLHTAPSASKEAVPNRLSFRCYSACEVHLLRDGGQELIRDIRFTSPPKQYAAAVPLHLAPTKQCLSIEGNKSLAQPL